MLPGKYSAPGPLDGFGIAENVFNETVHYDYDFLRAFRLPLRTYLHCTHKYHTHHGARCTHVCGRFAKSIYANQETNERKTLGLACLFTNLDWYV